MTVARGLSRRQLDRLIAEAEAAYSAAVAKAFRAATRRLVESAKAMTAAGLTPVGGMDFGDIALAQEMWAAEIPALSTYIGAAYGQSATSVGAALYAGSAGYIPDPAVPTLTPVGEDAAVVVVPPGAGVPVIGRMAIDRAGRDHLASATNRLVNAGDAMWADVRAQLVEGFSAGEGIREITQRLRGTAEVSRRRAETIARTEVIAASNAGAMAGARAVPAIAPAMKTWLATGDARTRPTHREADGQEVPLDQPFDVGGYPLDYPGADGPAEEVVNCRCTVTFGDPGEALPEGVDPEEAASEAEAARNRAAQAWGVSPEQVASSVADVQRLRGLVRAEAAEVQADALAWMDRADALRIRRPQRGIPRGGEYDWIEGLHPQERRRLTGQWFTDAAHDAPDVVWHRALESGATTAQSTDEFMEQWLAQSRRADAAGALRLGRAGTPNRYGGLTAGDISTVLEEQGLDINRIVGVDVEDAAGYLASTQSAQYAEQTYSILGPSTGAGDAAPWRMSFQSWEAEVRDLEAAIGEAELGGSDVASLTARHAELVPPNLDHGQSFEALYAETVEMARVAGMDVADWAVIPWSVPP